MRHSHSHSHRNIRILTVIAVATLGLGITLEFDDLCVTRFALIAVALQFVIFAGGIALAKLGGIL